MWFDASNIKNMVSESCMRIHAKPQKLTHFVQPKAPFDLEPEENFVPKEHQNIYLREIFSINGVGSERSTTKDSHQSNLVMILVSEIQDSM